MEVEEIICTVSVNKVFLLFLQLEEAERFLPSYYNLNIPGFIQNQNKIQNKNL